MTGAKAGPDTRGGGRATAGSEGCPCKGLPMHPTDEWELGSGCGQRYGGGAINQDRKRVGCGWIQSLYSA